MNTMTSLQKEEHINKELSSRLAELDEQLKSVTQQLEDKQRYVHVCLFVHASSCVLVGLPFHILHIYLWMSFFLSG
jgi:DNA-binding FrmR family transcriptional regulator